MVFLSRTLEVMLCKMNLVFTGTECVMFSFRTLVFIIASHVMTRGSCDHVDLRNCFLRIELEVKKLRPIIGLIAMNVFSCDTRDKTAMSYKTGPAGGGRGLFNKTFSCPNP